MRIKHGIINTLHFTNFRLENPGIHTVTLCCKISECKEKKCGNTEMQKCNVSSFSPGERGFKGTLESMSFTLSREYILLIDNNQKNDVFL